MRKAVQTWLATFLREVNSNIKFAADESLALVGNHIDMVSKYSVKILVVVQPKIHNCSNECHEVE